MSTNENERLPAGHGPQSEHDGADKNFDFVQVSRASLHAWGDLCMEKPLAAKILFLLIGRMGKTNNAVVCSYATLQELTGLSRTSVATAIKHLKKERWIATVKIGSATAYCVNERVAWQASRQQRKYAIFSATVVAAESEQSRKEIEDREKLKSIPFTDIVSSSSRAVVGNDDLPPPDQLDIDLN